jgi:hypothetical protein
MLYMLKAWPAGLACLLGAIQAVAKRLGKEEMGKKAVVHTSVHIGEPDSLPGFGLAVDITGCRVK